MPGRCLFNVAVWPEPCPLRDFCFLSFTSVLWTFTSSGTKSYQIPPPPPGTPPPPLSSNTSLGLLLRAHRAQGGSQVPLPTLGTAFPGKGERSAISFPNYSQSQGDAALAGQHKGRQVPPPPPPLPVVQVTPLPTQHSALVPSIFAPRILVVHFSMSPTPPPPL